MEQQGQQAVISGIFEEAQKKADEIIRTANVQIDEHQKSWSIQKENILRDAEIEATRRENEKRNSIISQITVEKKRKALREREALINKLISDTRAHMADKIDKPEYKNILLNWIVEAVIGLNLPRAIIKTSAAEKKIINRDFLDLVNKRASEIRGSETVATLDESDHLSCQGVVLSAEDGSVAFSNTVNDRIIRNQSDIQQAINKIIDSSDN